MAKKEPKDNDESSDSTKEIKKERKTTSSKNKKTTGEKTKETRKKKQELEQQEETKEENNVVLEEKKEETVVEPVNLEKPKKKKKKKVILIILIVLVSIALLGGGVYLFRDKIPVLDYFFGNKSKEKIELKYTETSDKPYEGVYITDVSEVVENVMPSIVAITSKTLISSGNFGPFYFGGDQYSEGAGSGIIIGKTDSNIMILTNNHVVENTTELSVQFINQKSFDAKIVGTSERKDIAVIAVPVSLIDKETLNTIRIATMGDSKKLKVGNGIIAIGNALGYGQSVTTGVVSALDREVSVDGYTRKMIQLDAAINGGNSGGALLNSQGEVVGINSAKYSSSAISSSASIEGMGFAIPISDVTDLITDLMNGEEDTGATIGVEGYIITKQYSRAYNIPEGFYISKIVSGSGADKANLEIGNIITKIEDEDVEDLSDLQDVLYDHEKGDKVTLTVSYVSGREYKEKKVTVTLS